MDPQVGGITLGVKDLTRAKQFYSALGWPIQQEDYNWVCFSLGPHKVGKMDDTVHPMPAKNLGDLSQVAYICLDHANLGGKARNHFSIGGVI